MAANVEMGKAAGCSVSADAGEATVDSTGAVSSVLLGVEVAAVDAVDAWPASDPQRKRERQRHNDDASSPGDHAALLLGGQLHRPLLGAISRGGTRSSR